jgi:hypothetical protein
MEKKLQIHSPHHEKRSFTASLPMALIIKSAIIAVFLVLGVMSYTSVYCIGAIGNRQLAPINNPCFYFITPHDFA